MQELEQRYIRLLEERCAKLEALLGEKDSETEVKRFFLSFILTSIKAQLSYVAFFRAFPVY